MVIGSIVMYAGSVAPTGWLLCDGSAVSRTTYQSLFDAIGTTHGEGDGTTTFNLPNISGRVLMGASELHVSSSIGGEETHSLLASEIPSHTHSIGTHGHSNGITITTPALAHTANTSILSSQKYYKSTKAYDLAVYSGTSSGVDGSPSENQASRTTNVSIDNHAPADCEVTGSISDCNSFNTNSSGYGTAHENMQPFVTMNYIIYAG